MRLEHLLHFGSKYPGVFYPLMVQTLGCILTVAASIFSIPFLFLHPESPTFPTPYLTLRCWVNLFPTSIRNMMLDGFVAFALMDYLSRNNS